MPHHQGGTVPATRGCSEDTTAMIPDCRLPFRMQAHVTGAFYAVQSNWCVSAHDEVRI
jgi:hypothetical protein